MSTGSAPDGVRVDSAERFEDLVGRFSGLRIASHRLPHLAQMIELARRRHGCATQTELVQFLEDPANQGALETFVGGLTIGESHFFRNRPQLDALRDHVLPQLIAQRSDVRRLSIWSAGCSTGEEAYTLAMLVDMALPRREGWDVSVIGTDLDRAALDRAREARYGSWSFRQVPDDLVRRFFVRHGSEHRVRPEIREMVSFAFDNLVEDGDPPTGDGTSTVDLIVCRNVLIYFSQATADRVVHRLGRALAPDGWLVTGHAETPMPVFRARFAARPFPMAVLFENRTAGDEPSTPSVHAPICLPAPVAVVSPAERGLEDAASRARGADVGSQCEEVRELSLAAEVLAGSGQLDAALDTVGRALAQDALSGPAHYLHGVILRALGRHVDAREALRRCVYLTPTFALGHYMLGETFAETGHPRRAERAFAAALECVSSRSEAEVVAGGDGLTVGGLTALVAAQHERLAGGGAA